MPVVTSTALIHFSSIFHISLAFFFLTAPHKIVSQSIVFLLGQSMRLVRQFYIDVDSKDFFSVFSYFCCCYGANNRKTKCHMIRATHIKTMDQRHTKLTLQIALTIYKKQTAPTSIPLNTDPSFRHHRPPLRTARPVRSRRIHATRRD